jgi:hypothetical protein
MPNAFDCLGGFHQAIVAIGEFEGEFVPGSAEEQSFRPARVNSRWPRHCDNCFYKFSEGDRWQFYTTPLSKPERHRRLRAADLAELENLTKGNSRCSRCRLEIKGFAPPNGGMSAGYYHITWPNGCWARFANEGEEYVCDACMWADPRYIAIYGKIAQ